MEKNCSFAVIGGGSWATAIVKMLCEDLDEVHWYMRNEEAKNHILSEGHNPNYLSSVEFNPDQLNVTTDINDAVNKAHYLIIAIPSAFVHKEFSKLNTRLDNKVIFSAVKGIVPESSHIVGEHLHHNHAVPYSQIGVISGPCHAEEVALERLSFLTIACSTEEHAQVLADILRSAYINVKVSEDIVGIEYAAVLKNIYAIAAGIAHGLGYGDNFQSVLMSNAIREMKAYIKEAHKIKRNINDSAYLGDLLVTGYSTFSRNRMFGTMVGKGYSVESAQLEMNMIAEGYYATKSAYALNETRQNKAKCPIIKAVYQILYGEKNPKVIFHELTAQLD